MKYIISKVLGVYSKGKDGQEYRTKKGDPYRKANVHFNEEGEKIIGVFLWDNQACEVGDEYEGTIESREYEGKTYYSFNGKKKEDKYLVEIAALKFSLANANRKIDEIVSFLKEKPWLSPSIQSTQVTSLPPIVKAAQVETADVINAEDIPF